jgi:hypothetical protein
MRTVTRKKVCASINDHTFGSRLSTTSDEHGIVVELEEASFVGERAFISFTGATQKGRSNDALVGAVGNVLLVDAAGMSGWPPTAVASVPLAAVSLSKHSWNGSAATTGGGRVAITATAHPYDDDTVAVEARRHNTADMLAMQSEIVK